MGDRASVNLCLLKADYDRALKQGIEIGANYEDCYDYTLGDVTFPMISLNYEECNYANIGIETELQEALIPYDKSWEPGGDFDSGNDYFRVSTEGEGILKEFEGGEEFTVNLAALVEAREGGLDGLDAFIAEQRELRKIMPWAEQVVILSKLRAKERLASIPVVFQGFSLRVIDEEVTSNENT